MSINCIVTDSGIVKTGLAYGIEEVLKTVDLDSNILIAANNNVADGTDISWINQANFEVLAGVNKEVVVTGLCAKEVEQAKIKARQPKTKVFMSIFLEQSQEVDCRSCSKTISPFLCECFQCISCGCPRSQNIP